MCLALSTRVLRSCNYYSLALLLTVYWQLHVQSQPKGTECEQKVCQCNSQMHLFLVSMGSSMMCGKREPRFLKRYEVDVEVGRYVC